jgi:tetrahydrodipicolinate N-succinyltransferase
MLMQELWLIHYNCGSCAQIGKDVHLRGVGIGGVLEPLQAAPVL